MAREKGSRIKKAHGKHGKRRGADIHAKALAVVEDGLAKGLTSSQICKSDGMRKLGIRAHLAPDYVNAVLKLWAETDCKIDREQKRAQIRAMMHNTYHGAMTYEKTWIGRDGKKHSRVEPDFQAAARMVETIALFEGVMEQQKNSGPMVIEHLLLGLQKHYYKGVGELPPNIIDATPQLPPPETAIVDMQVEPSEPEKELVPVAVDGQ